MQLLAIRPLFEQEYIDRGKHPLPHNRPIQIASLQQRVVLHRCTDPRVSAMFPDQHLCRAVTSNSLTIFRPIGLSQCSA